jgi:hypothetical protein
VAFTSLMLIPIPDEFEDPFFHTMNDAPGGYFDGVDIWLQALRENADLRIIQDGAPWTVDVGTNTVAWGTDIVLYSGTDGGTITILAGSVVAGSPSVLYVTLAARPVNAPVVLLMQTAPTVGVLASNDVVVALRTGAQAMLRNLVATHPPNVSTCAGNPNGVIVAAKVGDQCVDTVNSLTYVAYAADATHWQIG